MQIVRQRMMRKQVAAYFGCSLRTLDRRISKGKAPKPAFRIGTKPYWWMEEIVFWEQRQTETNRDTQSVST